MKRIFLSSVILILVSLACGQPAPTATPRINTPSPSTSSTSPALTNPNFTIGIEYGILGLADFYVPTGVKYAKLQNAFAVWGNIEPQPGQFNWGPLDTLVLEYQLAGFTGLQLDLSALSPWASSRQPAIGDAGDPFPKTEFLEAYSAFVTATVERYDGDGEADLPGLLYPILEYGIEREFTGFWPGSADEYVQLLRIAYPAIKAAEPRANVLLVALLMVDIFDGNPDPAELNKRLLKTPTYIRKSVPEIQTILAACDSFDMVDFHSLGNYTEIPPTTTWIRDQLDKNGCGQKPIWIGDAFPMSSLIGYGGLVPPTPFSPVNLSNREAVVAMLTEIADPGTPDYPAGRDWLYAEISKSLVRKTIVSAAQGVKGINIGNMEDWKTGVASMDKLTVPMLGASMFMGLTNTALTIKKPGGDLPFFGKDWSKARKASDPRPAFYALQLVIEKIGQFNSVSNVDMGSRVWAYHFDTPSGSVWVLWYDDGQLYLPGQKESNLPVRLNFPTRSAILTWTPTQFGQSDLGSQKMDALDGYLELTLTSVPLFIEEIP
jgi:hypothetical protein